MHPIMSGIEREEHSGLRRSNMVVTVCQCEKKYSDKNVLWLCPGTVMVVYVSVPWRLNLCFVFLSAVDDDVDLEALVNDMASLSSYDSSYATCGTLHSDSAPLLHRSDGGDLHGNKVAPLPRAPSNKVTVPHFPAQRLRRSQPVHIQAVR